MQPTAPNSQELHCLISLISLSLAQRWAGYRSPSDGDASGPEPVNTPLEAPSKDLQRAVPTAKDQCQGTVHSTGLRLLRGFRGVLGPEVAKKGGRGHQSGQREVGGTEA